MNANLKNGLVTLAMVGASATVLSGLIYGVKKGLEAEKPNIMVTDPQKAEQDLQTESDVSRILFEATRNIKTEQSNEINEPLVIDITELCREIGVYKQINNDIISDLKAGKHSDASFHLRPAEEKEAQIRNALDKLGYQKPYAPQHITTLGDEFEKYVKKTKSEIAALMNQ